MGEVPFASTLMASRTSLATGTLGDAAMAFGRTAADRHEIYVVNNGGAFLSSPRAWARDYCAAFDGHNRESCRNRKSIAVGTEPISLAADTPVSPRVEYSLTDLGRSLSDMVGRICWWAVSVGGPKRTLKRFRKPVRLTTAHPKISVCLPDRMRAPSS